MDSNVVQKLATEIVEATAWKTVDDRKVEVNVAEWDAAVALAKAVLRGDVDSTR